MKRKKAIKCIQETIDLWRIQKPGNAIDEKMVRDVIYGMSLAINILDGSDPNSIIDEYGESAAKFMDDSGIDSPSGMTDTERDFFGTG